MSDLKCKTCRWFAELLHENECRRYPPHRHEGWPEVIPNNFCGEHSEASKSRFEGVIVDGLHWPDPRSKVGGPYAPTAPAQEPADAPAAEPLNPESGA